MWQSGRGYLLLFGLALLEAGLYLYGYHVVPTDGTVWASETDPATVTAWRSERDTVRLTSVVPGGPAARAGLREGDRLVAINGRPIRTYSVWSSLDDYRARDTVAFTVLRGAERRTVPVTLASRWEEMRASHGVYYVLILLVALTGLFVLARKPGDPSARLFFVFAQVHALCLNAEMLTGGPLGTFRLAVFLLVFPFQGSTILHFFLRFPHPSRLLRRFPRLPWAAHLVSLCAGLLMAALYLRFRLDRTAAHDAAFIGAVRLGLLWMGTGMLAALLVAVDQFRTVREVVAHNQLRWVMIGVGLGLLPEVVFGFYPDLLWRIELAYPDAEPFFWGIASTVLLTTLSFAILRYRIWDAELVLRRGLLYATLTLSVAGLYLLVVWALETRLHAAPGTARMAGVLLGALAFVPVRELVQRRVDRLFHREGHDPMEAALTFEARLSGLYTPEALHDGIARAFDSLFHFERFALALRTPEGAFAGVAGNPFPVLVPDEELAHRLDAGRPFAVSELRAVPEGLAGYELVVPLTLDGEVLGLAACGPKRSERPYGQEDVALLQLLARRAAALLNTAALYRKELERQQAVERERARIAQDVHDEVGASLTRIAILSELAQRETGAEAASHVRKISETSRGVIDELSEIIWAINPQHDTLAGLVAYLRQHVAEFLEDADLRARLDFPEDVPEQPVSAEFRRNVYLVVKEAVCNAARHAHATEVAVTLAATPAALRVQVTDDGRGFEAGTGRPFGNGLTNMRQRAEALGGTLDVASAPGHGATVTLDVPLTRG